MGCLTSSSLEHLTSVQNHPHPHLGPYGQVGLTPLLASRLHMEPHLEPPSWGG